MIPTDTLVANRAMMSPLMARKAARGLSESRRPARSTDGRPARRAMTREPTMVSHGPAMTSPAMISRHPEKYASIWPPVLLGRPDDDEVGELGDARGQRHQPVGPGRRRRDPPGDPERRDVHPAHGDAGRQRGRERDADHDERGCRPGPSERSPGAKGCAGEGDLGQRRAEQEKHAEAERPRRRAAATAASTAEITETCRGVAPTRRMAAKRCSRRAADSRVAVPMKISTGKSKASAPTARMTWSLLASQPLAPSTVADRC